VDIFTVFWESAIGRSVETSGSLTRRWVVSRETPFSEARAFIYSDCQGPSASSGRFIVLPPACAQLMVVVCPRFGGLFRGTWSRSRLFYTDFDCKIPEIEGAFNSVLRLQPSVRPAASIRFGDYHTAQMAQRTERCCNISGTCFSFAFRAHFELQLKRQLAT